MELEGGGDWDLGGVKGWNSYPVKSISPSSCMASSASLWWWVSFGMASTTVGTEVGVASLVGVTLHVTLGFIGALTGAGGALRTGRLVAYTGTSVFLAVLRPSVAARTGLPLGGAGAGPFGLRRRLRVSLLARERLEKISISSISRDLGLSLSRAVLDRGR